ncbi:MAG TPA: lipoprotein [Rhodanobacter sp.]
MRPSILLLSLCLLAAMLAGCGQKGPLVLPPTKPTASRPHAPAVAASVDTPANDQY